MKTSILAAISALMASSLTAQTGSVTPYGNGCVGFSPGPGCISQNWGTPFQGITASSTTFAIKADSGPSAQVVCGLQLFCRTVGNASVNLKVWIYDKAPAGGPGVAIASGTMPVTRVEMANTLLFGTPLKFAPYTEFYIVFDNSVGVRLPINSSGTKVGTHYHSGPAWAGPFTSNLFWAYNLLCCGSLRIPQIGNSGVPTINQSFSIDLSYARLSASSLLAIGVTRIAVPLGTTGAPGCVLYTDPVVLIAQPVSTAGTVSTKLSVPNDSRLVGLSVFGQYAVTDPVNNLGLVFSPGVEMKVGR